jgi:two-component system, cell cycle sensor histidine kinase and response regulator CckA
MDSRDDRLQKLEETVRLLTMENEALTERAEDTLLLGLIAEKIGAAADSAQVLETGLEQIALLKDVPLCACCAVDGGLALVRTAYVTESNRSLDGAVAATAPAFAEALGAGTVTLDGGAWAAFGLDALAEAIGFTPTAGLVIAFALHEGGTGFFLFADDRADARFGPSTVVLKRAVELITSRLDTIHLLGVLRTSNRRLDQHVAERTRELDAANVDLRREIAERERAQQALTVSLEKYRLLFETFPLGITVSDAEGRIIEANQASAALLGLAADEHTQRTISSSAWRIVDSDGVPLAPDAFASSIALREQRPVHNQIMGVTRPDGTTVWLNVSAAPIPLEGFGVAVTYGDVSGRREAELALQRAEQHYRALFDHAAEGVALHRLVRDGEGRVVNYVITDINPQYERIIGLRRDRVVGRLATEVYGTDIPPYLEEFSSAPMTGAPRRFETYFPPLDKHFSISVAPMGEYGFATIFFDVTALRKSQEEHEKLSALVENSNELVGLASLDLRLLYVNEAGRRLLGLAKDHPLEGMTIFDLAQASARPAIEGQILPVVRATGSWSGEAAVLDHTTGAAVPVDVSLFTIPSRTTGEPICLAAVMRDIRERVRARAEQARLEGELRQAQKMESIGRLAGGVAHDFNNLLTSILGNTELVMESTTPSDPSHALLADVMKAGESAASLTRQLLAFSRKQIIEPTVLNLNVLIANMERMLRRIIGEDVALETRLRESVSRIRADAGQIEQVVVNLAVNARDAMADGGHLVLETSEVDLDEETCRRTPGAKPGRYVVLAVSDTGLGMDEETRAHVFEPFFTTKRLGTGLGLATVYGAVSQNGGFVGVESRLGHGTTFRIYLPAVPDICDVPVQAAQPGLSLGTETILLVEDDALVRELARRALAGHGFRVLACGSGAEALSLAAQHQGPLDLLLTDVVMPGMNGRDLAVRLAATRPGLRTLFTSGYTDHGIVHQGLLEPGLHFLPKPYTPQTLAEKVRAVLDGR